MKVEFKKNPRAIDVINPYVTLEEWQAMAHGNFTITPNTIVSHFFTPLLAALLVINLLAALFLGAFLSALWNHGVF